MRCLTEIWQNFAAPVIKGIRSSFHLWIQPHDILLPPLNNVGSAEWHRWFMLNGLNLICTRWPKTLVDSNTYRPAQKTGGKVCFFFCIKLCIFPSDKYCFITLIKRTNVCSICSDFYFWLAFSFYIHSSLKEILPYKYYLTHYVDRECVIKMQPFKKELRTLVKWSHLSQFIICHTTVLLHLSCEFSSSFTGPRECLNLNHTPTKTT